MRPKQTTADDTDITDVVEAFVPNVCVGADPLGTADTTAQRTQRSPPTRREFVVRRFRRFPQIQIHERKLGERV